MNADTPENAREKMEAQLTALLLGELSADEAAKTRAAMEHDPGLAELHGQLQHAIGLVREVATSPGKEVSAPAVPMQLSGQRRERLQAAFRVAVAPVQTRSWTWFIPMSIAAVLMALIGSVLLLPVDSKRKMISAAPGRLAGAQSQAELAPETVRRLTREKLTPPTDHYYFQNRPESRGRTGAKQTVELDTFNKGITANGPTSGTFGGGGGGLGGFGRAEAEKRIAEMGQRGSKPATQPPAPVAPALPAARSVAGSDTGTPLPVQLWADYSNDGNAILVSPDGARVAEDRAAGAVQFGSESLEQARPSKADVNGRGDAVKGYFRFGEQELLGKDVAGVPILGDRPALGWAFQTESKASAQGGSPPAAPAVEPPSTTPLAANRLSDLPALATSTAAAVVPNSQSLNFDVQSLRRYGLSPREEPALRDSAGNSSPNGAATAPEQELSKFKSAAIDQVTKERGVRLAQPSEPLSDREERLARLQGQNRGLLEGQMEQADKKESKPAVAAPIPQPEIETSANPVSTFSLNVSDVSFKLAAASLEKGQLPDPATVRTEEFINAFDYHDPEPAAGMPVGFAWERARYPFAHDRDLLRFSIKTAAAGRQPGAPLNVVLLLDRSGSMERADRVQIVQEALRVLAGQLQPQDKLSVITFARTARLWADGVAGNEIGPVLEQVSNSTPEGGTNLEDALQLAYQTALRHHLERGGNRVVLMTDGAANLGDVNPEALKQKVETYRKQGVALDCFGIGWEGFDDEVLETLSRNGDGRYRFLNTPEEAASGFAQQLAGALHVAASDVKVQVEFNPKRVTLYRQMGYAKHQLTKEQFRDNTVDAAEIAAAESGNALYTVQVNAAGDGPLATVRVRYKVPGTAEYREQEWIVPYTGQVGTLEQASPSLRLAGTAAAFAEWLASSPYAGEVTPDRLSACLSGVPQSYGSDTRPRTLESMIQQAKSIGK